MMMNTLLITRSIAQESFNRTCQFSRDCDAYRDCREIQDASCVCNFGQCVITGNPFFRGNECDEFPDCTCKDNPANCFCRDGFCDETAWECHNSTDCSGLNKCQDRNCTCSGNLCEFDCATDVDCKDFHCNQALGYMCKCEDSLCAYKQLTPECNSIADCITQGKCSSDSPCACTQEYCTVPWWVSGTRECRNDKDCEATIADCEGGKCSCQNFKPLEGGFEMRGTCFEKLPEYKKYNDAIVMPGDQNDATALIKENENDAIVLPGYNNNNGNTLSEGNKNNDAIVFQ